MPDMPETYSSSDFGFDLLSAFDGFFTQIAMILENIVGKSLF